MSKKCSMKDLKKSKCLMYEMNKHNHIHEHDHEDRDKDEDKHDHDKHAHSESYEVCKIKPSFKKY